MITKSNISHLEEMIGQVSSMLDWVNQHTQSSKRLVLAKSLVNARRRLKRIYNAMSDNPTIAAYGESQQGKSYIISSLLSSPGRPLTITDGYGKSIDFIDKINFKGDNQESTGVVTRFTTTMFMKDAHFPVRLRLLSVADIVTILTDSYMKDTTGYQPYSEKDLEGISDRLIERYSERKAVQDRLTEDEIGDIEEFIKKHDTVASAVYVNSSYFNVLSTIIRRVPESEWLEALSPLWKENETWSKFFTQFVSVYSALGFSRDVYIPIRAVLNDSDDECKTLMCVRALDGLKDVVENGLSSGTQTEVLLPNGTTQYVNKCMLSAMTAEAVYYIEDSVLNDEISFNFSGIRDSEEATAEENVKMLKQFGIGQPFKKNFLKGIDFLDFPGARGRDMGYLPSQTLDKLAELLLRSKVSYLFNKYSEDLKLSILMFCHSQGNTTPNLVAPILKSWVETYIGETPEKRKGHLANYSIPPLFLISTMYNKDLVIKRGDVDTQIWERRLNTILYKEVINGNINNWFDRWVPEGKFENTFLLRDYFYSSDSNEGNNLFKGYPGPETEEIQPDERAKLKRVFLKDSGVRRFFSNAELAWDVSSTIGNDGSYYMLKRLSEASERAAQARDIKFNEDIEQAMGEVLESIKDEYRDEKDTELLEQSIRNARKFHFILLRACEKQSDFFGRMIQFLQLNTNFVTSFFSKIIHSGQMLASTDVKDYELIVRGVEEAGYQFDSSVGEAAFKRNMKVLEDVFGVSGPDDPMLKGIDLTVLFQSTYKKQCSPSTVLSTQLIDYWRETLMKPENSVRFIQAGFDELAFSNFITNFTNMMMKVNLAGEMANAIKEYVDFSPAIAPHNEELIADIATNIYNAFVMNLGYNYLAPEQKEKTTEICAKFNLPKVVENDENAAANLTDEEQLISLFNQLERLNDGDGGQLTLLPSYISMKNWIAFVFMSFTIAYDIVQYDEKANKLLGGIIEEAKANIKLLKR